MENQKEKLIIKSLLRETSKIAIRYANIEKNTGYKFNIFTITKIERLEVNTHSAMIAELLDPNGSHGQGDIFLIKFIDCISKCLAPSVMKGKLIDFSNVKLFKEKSYNLGKNRIDIIVEFNNFVFFIENKIDASDGDEQIKRYFNVGLSHKKDFCLLYLTKYGNDAIENSHCGVPYEKISYSEHIVEWLEDCIKEVALIPIVREAIVQYLNLVKKITGKNMNSDLREEIVELLLEDNNLRYAQDIALSITEAKAKALFLFFKKIEIEIVLKNSSLKVVKNINKERLYGQNKCLKWFSNAKDKPQSFGVFFDINESGVLFHVEVATKILHYGFVKVKTNTGSNYEILNEKIVLNVKYEKRDWDSIPWYSFKYRDVFESNTEILLHPDDLVNEIIDEINYFKRNK